MSLPADAIALVGMSGRFPGAKTIAEFWENLAAGRDSITHFEEEDGSATPSVRARGVLEDAEFFDAEFFGIQPREAELMDPQHRIFLECAWEALETAGYNPQAYAGLIGVYAGLSLSSYLLYNLDKASGAAPRLASGYPVGDFPTLLGNERDYLPTRVAYKLNLRGPSMAIQTACSTSLVAICQACTALQTYQCDMALAGGVSVTFPQDRVLPYEEGGMISPDGVCRSFDAGAQGTVFSNGAGVVVLKRLEDVRADGDTVLAVIRGFAVNNDGSDKMGFAAPGLNAQADVIASAHAAAGLAPSEISYVEAHGTATPLGDPIEVAALTRAFRAGGAGGNGFCALGTAKANIGHLDVAAGVAGVIKTVLQLRHEHIPALKHFHAPNPHIDFANSPFFPVDQPRPWPRGGVPRRAGVSSFGVGGTNAHVVLEEAPGEVAVASPRRTQLLVLSARSASALRRMETRLADHLELHRDLDLADVSHSLAMGRRAFGYRRAVVAATVAEAIRILREPAVLPPALPEDPARGAADLLARLPSAGDPAPLQAQLGSLWEAGTEVDWSAYFAGETRRRVPLPTYPFERKRFWIAPPEDGTAEEAPVEEISESGDRSERLLQTVRGILEELSGRSLTETGVPFSELGFDSLALTQVSQAVFSRFGVRIAFRQLLGALSTLDALAAHLDETLPADAPVLAARPAETEGGSRQPLVRWPSKKEVSPAATARFGPYKPIQRDSAELTPHQRRALDDLIARYVRRTEKSKNYTGAHRPHFADPRAVAGFNPLWKEMVYPIVSESSKGATIRDIDGNSYVDVTMGFGTYFFGHSPDWLVAAVQDQLQRGIEIGPQSASAGAIAQEVCAFTGQDRATFCNTGSEAVMAALRLARNATGRTRVVYFTGDYHGMFDEVLVRGAWVNGVYRAQPVAPGIPPSLVENMLVLDYGAPETLEILRRHANELAAILVEPVQSRRPDLQPRAFLQEVRAISERAGAALIFDEVVTGFRCHPGGAQAYFGIEADMSTYGKVLGGGIPIGVLAGKRKFMDALDGGAWNYGDASCPEVGMTFFAGTFVRHPLAMAAAKAVFRHLREQGPGLQLRMTERTGLLARTLEENCAAVGVPLRVPHFSAVAGIDMPHDLPHAGLLWYYLREKGVHIWEGRPLYLTDAHTNEDFDQIITAFRESVGEMQEAGFLPPPPEGASLGLRAEFPRADRAPTTEAQREIWASAQMGPDASRAFNESCAIELTGTLDRIALEKSLLHVVQRHEALRSVFSDDGAEQIFHPAPRAVDLSVLDLSGLSGEERALRVAQERAACTAHVFPLTSGPLVLLRLLVLAPDRHVLLFTAHHLVCDGWALGMIVEELSKSYNAFVRDAIPMLPPPLPFGEYARTLHAETLEQKNQADRVYWTDLFRDLPPALDLPLDRPRPPLKTSAGAMETWVVDADCFARLKKAAPALGGTFFSTLLAVFGALLHRLSGQDDLVVGVPSAGQTLVGCNELVGHCLNFLPVRLRCDGGKPFREFAAAVGQDVLAATEHQNFTFGSLVRELKVPRDPARLPLVSVMFNIDKSGFDSLTFDGLDFRVLTNAKQFVNFDLFFNLLQDNERLEIECEYNTDLFSQTSVRRWLASFERLLEGILEAADAPVARLPILGPEEKTALCETWNATARDFDRTAGVHDLVAAAAAAHPDKTAVRCGDRALSYRQLEERATAIAARLRSLGVCAGDRVGLCLERSTDMAAGLLGILKTGAAYVPMDPLFPAERLGWMVEDARMPVLLTQRTLVSTLPPHQAQTLLVEDIPDEPVTGFTPVRSGGENPAYVIFTSGSTGRPKGVCVPHRAFVNFLHSMQREPGFGPDDTLFSVTTLSFDISGLEIFLPLTTGGTVVVAAREATLDGNLLRSELVRSGATVMQATPVTWRLLLDAGWPGDPKLRILIGGEAVPRELVNRLAPLCGELWNLYGPTETTIWSTVGRLEAGDGPVSIGRPIDNTRVFVVNSALQIQPIGVPGELLIAGDGLALGYLDQPALTADRFLESPLDADSRLYRTGDLARWQADGSLECLGRLDHQVKLRGFRIELGEIEARLETHPDIAQAIVQVRDDRLVAWVRLRHSATGGGGSTQWQDKWESIFQTALSQAEGGQLDHLDSVINSWTGVENAGAQVEEWIAATVARIRSLQPRCVLEIGCGTGQLLARLAPGAESYWAADISRAAIAALEQSQPPAQVKLLCRAADDFSEIPEAFFDTVVINSVAQYFPDAEYLGRVLQGAVRVLKPGGRIFLGDMQSRALAPVHHLEEVVHRAESGLTCGQAREKVAQRMAREKELSVDPAWFGCCGVPGIAHYEILLRRGALRNETTNYHYDVILHAAPAPPRIPLPAWRVWNGEDAAAFGTLLAGGPETLALRGIPDARLAGPLELHHAVAALPDEAPVPAFPDRAPGLDAEQLTAVAEAAGYRATVRWQGDGTSGLLDGVFQRPSAPLPLWEEEPGEGGGSELVNHPWKEDGQDDAPGLSDMLRRHLAETLPEYMIPSRIVPVREFPLTPNGKVNRAALILPERNDADPKEPPQTEREKDLAAMWTEILGVTGIGRNDDFFELGGHSLFAFRLFSEIQKRTGLSLPLASLFRASTLRGLAELMDSQAGGSPGTEDALDSILAPIQEEGTQAPLFCIHGGDGGVLFYRDLARHLPKDRPLLAIESPALTANEEVRVQSVEELAARYLRLLRRRQESGPYFLGGYSFGGLVAYEMACLLREQGEEVAFLALFDTVSATSPRRLYTLRERIVRNWHWNPDANLAQRMGRILSRAKEKVFPTPVLSEPEPVGEDRAWELGRAHEASIEMYRPRSYPGKVTLFKALAVDEIYKYPDDYGWGSVAAEVEVVDIPGGHLSVFDPEHLPTFGAELARRIQISERL